MEHDVTSLKTELVRPVERRPWNTGYEARIATDDHTRQDAYRLRYSSYHSRGHIAANASGLFSDEYDATSTTTTVVVYANGNPVGSVRTCLLQRGAAMKSPALYAYPEEVAAILAEHDPHSLGFNCVEVNRLVRAPQSADDQGLVFMLLRLAGRLGMVADFKVSISCVRAHHLPFYRRMRFVEAGPMRTYPGLNCEMALLKLPRSNWDATRKTFQLMDPEAGPPGLLHGLEDGRIVRPHLMPRPG